MSWCIALVFLVVLAASPTAAHDEATLDPHNASPGLRLELIAMPRTPPSIGRYRLHAVGFPPDIPLSVWAQDFGDPFRQVASGLRLDETGNVLSTSDGQHRPAPLTLRPGPHPPGAAWRVALVSADRALRAFAGAIPHPITARDGSCTVTLELVSYRGDRFVATGTGFVPEDEVVTESQYSGRVTQKRRRISSAGLLPLEVIAHAATGNDHSARYLAKGRSCEVVVKYNWGEAALLRRKK